MHILVTGGLGFIGSHTVDALLALGHKIRVLDNVCAPVHQNGVPNYLPKNCEWIRGDVRNKSDWERSLQGIEAVYHLAAYQDYLPDFSTFFHTNGVGTALLYEIAVAKKLPLQRIVVASSQAVYGEGRYCCAAHGVQYPDIRTESQLAERQWDLLCPHCQKPLQFQTTDESRVNPQNQYALSKYMEESIALNLGRRYQIPTVALRYSIVQGPRQSFTNAYSGACRVFCLAYAQKQQPPIFEDGLQWRDYVNIVDVVTANLLVLEHPKAVGQVFNVGGGKSYTVLEMARIAAEEAGQPFEPKSNHQYRFGDTRHIVSDISRLCSIGWTPRRSPKDSVRDYLDWLATLSHVGDVIPDAVAKMRSLNVIRTVGGSR